MIGTGEVVPMPPGDDAGRPVDDDRRTDLDRPADDSPEAVAARLKLTVGRLVRQLRRYGAANVGPGALSALATLHRCGPMRLGDLAAREAVAPPTLSRIVAALEEAGYVDREVDPRDRRAVQVRVTPAGAAVVLGVGEARTGELATRVRSLPPESLATLAAALPVLETLTADDA
jgi:DNA-binding MarR family transcriptional regulator